jgi:hypothetical protein
MDKNLDEAVEAIPAAPRAAGLAEMVKLHAELAHLYAISEHGKKPAGKFSLH